MRMMPLLVAAAGVLAGAVASTLWAQLTRAP